MSALIQDVRFGLRMLNRSRGFTFVAVITLALGVAITTAISGVVNAVLLRALPYRSPDRLVMLWERDPQKGLEQERVTPADFADWREQNRVFENLAFSPAWPASRAVNFLGNDGSEKIPGAFVSSGFFPVLGVKPVLGRTFVSEEDRPGSSPVAVLSYALWQRRFRGDSHVLGQTVGIDIYGFRRYAVIGVMPSGFQFPDQAEIWLPAGYMGVRVPDPDSNERCCPWFQVFGRLKPGVTLDQAQRQMSTIARRIAEQRPQNRFSSDVKVVPLLEQLVGSVRRALVVLLGAVGCVLLIACANVANLLLARATGRQREFAVRTALGATRGRLIRQSLTESLLLALLGGALGALLAAWGLRLVVAIAADKVPRIGEARIDAVALGFTLLLSLLTALFFGAVPAWQASKTNPNQALKEAGQATTEGGRRRRLRSLLVVSEIALALVLLVGAGLLMRSFARLLHVDPGFQVDHVLTAHVDMTGSGYPGQDGPQSFFQQLMTRVRGLPGVQSVGGVLAVPLSGGFQTDQAITLEGQPLRASADSPKVDPLAITPDYFQTMRIPLLKGRSFTERDARNAPMVAIVNETMAAHYWPGGNPVGRRFALGSRERLAHNPTTGEPAWISIIAVVGDVRDAGLETAPRPQVFFSYRQYPWTEAQLVVKTSGAPLNMAAAIRNEARTLDKNALVTRFASMQQVVADSIAQPRFQTMLLGLFSALALVLAGVGVYGAMTYSVAQRTDEIGIRMAVGAQPRDVLKLVVREGMMLTLAGTGIGLLAAFGAARVLAGSLYGVTTRTDGP